MTGNGPEERGDPGVRVVSTSFPDAVAAWKQRLGLQPEKGLQEQLGVPLKLRFARNSWTSRFSTALKGMVAFPDEHKAWKPIALEAARKLLGQAKVEALLSSSSPVTAHLVARELRSSFRLPWLAELRDLWTQNHNYPYGRIRRYFERRLERKTLACADALVTVSAPWAEELRRLHGRDRVYSIPNGFDPERLSQGPASLTPEFTITYTGTLYAGKQNPQKLLLVLQKLLLQGQINSEILKVRFYGPKSPWLAAEIDRFGLSSVVEQKGPVPREESFRKQRESQVLLIFYWEDPGVTGWYPLKAFEYLAAQRPILAFGASRENVLKDLMTETRAGIYCQDVDEIGGAILQAFREFRQRGFVPYDGDLEKIRRYSYREMARKLAEVLDRIAG